MNVVFIGLGRMGVVQARLARAFGDHLCFGCDTDPSARTSFHEEFNIPVSSQVQDLDGVDLIWITVNDDAIENVAATLEKCDRERLVVLHTSGALSSEVLSRHLKKASCASFHPLMACPLRETSDDACVSAYRGVIHAYEGDAAACDIARKLIERIHGDGVQIQNKIRYHAGAVFASNYLLACLHAGCTLLEKSGLTHEQALRGALQMARQNFDAVEKSSLDRALTGPVKRRDFATIQKHEDALADQPDLLALYRALKVETQKLAGYREAEK